MDVDRDAWEEEQLRLAIENSLADLDLKGAEEPPNEFASQDLAFFTDKYYFFTDKYYFFTDTVNMISLQINIERQRLRRKWYFIAILTTN